MNGLVRQMTEKYLAEPRRWIWNRRIDAKSANKLSVQSHNGPPRAEDVASGSYGSGFHAVIISG